MTKKVLYLYLGTNGTILSPVHLEDTYYVRQVELMADEGKLLTRDGVHMKKSVLVPENDLSKVKTILGTADKTKDIQPVIPEGNKFEYLTNNLFIISENKEFGRLRLWY